TAPQSLVNVVLSVTRNGRKLREDSLDYDVQLWGTSGTPYAVPVTAADGIAPDFTDLATAVNAILAEDPTGKANPTDLTAPQCLHIARELVANRYADPLPTPSSQVMTLYTTGSDDERRHFESALQAYYARLEAEATRLAGYIYAWSAALACQALTEAAPQAALTFPVRVTSAPGVGQAAQATVIVHN